MGSNLPMQQTASKRGAVRFFAAADGRRSMSVYGLLLGCKHSGLWWEVRLHTYIRPL